MDKIINTSRFVPDKGFSGTVGEGSDKYGVPRGSGPVQVNIEFSFLNSLFFLV